MTGGLRTDVAAATAAHCVEVHRRHGGSVEARKTDCDLERRPRFLLRTRGRRHRGPLSDSEDRRRIGRACVSGRTRAADHQTNRTIKKRDMRRLTTSLRAAACARSVCRLRRRDRPSAAAKSGHRWATGIPPSSTTGRRCKPTPNRTEYRIALERAMLSASRVHFDTRSRSRSQRSARRGPR